MQQLSESELRILAEIKLRNLVKDLHGIADDEELSDPYISERCVFAASEIERLIAEVKKLRAEVVERSIYD